MKRLLITIFLAGLLMYAFSCCYAEQIAVHLDSREWEMGYRAKDETQGIAEFILKGETLRNWTEIVVGQTFFGLQKKSTAKEWAEAVMKDIRSMSPDASCNIIRNGTKDILFEWEIKNLPGQQDQHEISRAISGTEGIHIIHYATRKLPLSPEKRKEWIKLLSQATLTR
jgi:hypothetical protein